MYTSDLLNLVAYIAQMIVYAPAVPFLEEIAAKTGPNQASSIMEETFGPKRPKLAAAQSLIDLKERLMEDGCQTDNIEPASLSDIKTEG